MKKTVLLMALATFLVVLVACGDKQANQQSATAGEKTEANATDTATNSETDPLDAEYAEGANDGEVVLEIASKWDSKPLKNIVTEDIFDVERFAYVFADEYSDFKPNKVICEYLDSPEKFKKKESLFGVRNMKKNGYLECSAQTEVSWGTTCCYWKRKNGHALVAFWLERGHEGEDELSETALAFYDFNPETDTMTPEPALCKIVEDIARNYDAYLIKLPEEGKDINLYCLTYNKAKEYYESTPYLLRWNGNDFKAEKVKEEDI